MLELIALFLIVFVLGGWFKGFDDRMQEKHKVDKRIKAWFNRTFTAMDIILIAFMIMIAGSLMIIANVFYQASV